MPVLEVRDLVCSFRGREVHGQTGNVKTVLTGVSFSIDRGTCLGLIGDSGSGKSTIARCIAGLTLPDAGLISLLGTNVFPDVKNRKTLPGAVQMLFQDHASSLDPIMTVRDSLAEGIRARKNVKCADDTAVADLLHRVGLASGIASKLPGELSGGERQRVALARSLSVEPALLVLDEPTSALDASTQQQILDLLVSVQAETTAAILFISHDIASVSRICSDIAVLHGGRIVECGTTASILEKPRHAYTKLIAAAAGHAPYPL